MWGATGTMLEELRSLTSRVGARVTKPIGFDSIAAGAVTSAAVGAARRVVRLRRVPRPRDPAMDQPAVAVPASDAIALLHLSSSLREEGKAALFAIASTDQGELFGAVSVREVDHRRRQALIGYWVAVEARRRGAATARGRGAVAVGDGRRSTSTRSTRTCSTATTCRCECSSDAATTRTARAAARSAASRSRRPATCSGTSAPRSAPTRPCSRSAYG